MEGTPIASFQTSPSWDASQLSRRPAEECRLPASPVIPASPQLRPAYADAFRCIGSACEDTCCQGWTIPVNRETWEKYQALPPSPLQILLEASVARTPNSPDATDDPAVSVVPTYATIRMDGTNQCPLLTEDRLCRIQAELGETMLSQVCATYPRIVQSLGGTKEEALALSCPEAVRLVLLTPNLLAAAERPGTDAGASFSAPGKNASSLPEDFWPIRSVVLNLVRMRAYPLWQRLFLLGILSTRLDAIARGDDERTVPEFLADFKLTVATGSLRPAMERLPIDRTAQLDVVLRLAGLMLHKSNIRPRFVECIDAFTKGIGNGPGSTLASLSAHYAMAHDRYFAPFIDRHPYIMENLLVNIILRSQFPFGWEAIKAGTAPQMSREFALLSAQFALMRGLLIGVAGHHGRAFSTAHVVHTVQAASKHFEHHPDFLKMAHALLVESRMDGVAELAVLLRNAEMDRGIPAARPASEGIYAPGQPDGKSAWAPVPAGKVRPV
jgi:lysine-N-methylase